MFVEPHCINLLKKFEIAYGKEFFYRLFVVDSKINYPKYLTSTGYKNNSLINQDITNYTKSLLTLPNIQYLVQGLMTLNKLIWMGIIAQR